VLVIIKHVVLWRVDFYGAENWTLQKVDQKYLKSCDCGAGEG
jgi:hypothetical protein